MCKETWGWLVPEEKRKGVPLPLDLRIFPRKGGKARGEYSPSQSVSEGIENEPVLVGLHVRLRAVLSATDGSCRNRRLRGHSVGVIERSRVTFDRSRALPNKFDGESGGASFRPSPTPRIATMPLFNRTDVVTSDK